ncbi:hypothetical protein BDF19DRAFT_420095 [Syncephalis fuscata]|nr:hypothetical protein BDF19DRAFT_420095 [Syncephalis fuscata]
MAMVTSEPDGLSIQTAPTIQNDQHPVRISTAKPTLAKAERNGGHSGNTSNGNLSPISPSSTQRRHLLPATSYATLDSQFSMAATAESDLTFLPAHTAASLYSLINYPPTVTHSNHTLSSINTLVTVPVHAPVYAGHLKTLVPESKHGGEGSNGTGHAQARWYRREFRFDGRLLCCLDSYKCHAPPDTHVDHPQQEDKPYWPTDPYPTPALNSPLLSTPCKTASYLAGKQEPVKYFQRLLWSLPVSDIEGIEVIRPPSSVQSIVDAALNAVSYARRKRQRARERCLVLRTVGGNVRVLRAESVRDLQRWAYILTQAWAMYIWVGRARDTVNELSTVNILGNGSTAVLPMSSAASMHGSILPVTTSTPTPTDRDCILPNIAVASSSNSKSAQMTPPSSTPTADSNKSNKSTDNKVNNNNNRPADSNNDQMNTELTRLSREDAKAYVTRSFVHITDDQDAEIYQKNKAILQHEGKERSLPNNVPSTTTIIKPPPSIKQNKTPPIINDDDDDDDDEDLSLADSMKALNGEHQRYSLENQRDPIDHSKMNHQRSKTEYSINAAVLPAALMEQALDIADREEAERKQRLQSMSTNGHHNMSTLNTNGHASASSLIAISGTPVTTVTRRTSRPTRTSSTGRIRRGLSTLRRERRPRRVEVVLVDGDDKILTRSTSSSKKDSNGNSTDPKFQARVARIQSTRGVIVQVSNSLLKEATTNKVSTAKPSNKSNTFNTLKEDVEPSSNGSTSTGDKLGDGIDSISSDLKRRGAKRSPIIFNGQQGDHTNSNSGNTGSVRGVSIGRSRSNSVEAPVATSPQKSVTIAQHSRVHMTDVNVVSPVPRPVADTSNLQRYANIISHKPSDASLSKKKEKQERDEKSNTYRERRPQQDRSEMSRHRASYHAPEESTSKTRECNEGEEKYHSHRHRSSDNTASARVKNSSSGNTNTNNNSNSSNSNRWDDLDENWIDDDEDNWYDRRGHRHSNSGDGNSSGHGHSNRRSYDNYNAHYMASLQHDYRGPPLPPPPPPLPPPPPYPSMPYTHYRDTVMDNSRSLNKYPPPPHRSSYDAMGYPPPHHYPYHPAYYQQQAPLQPPRLSLGADRSSTGTFGGPTTAITATTATNDADHRVVDPYNNYATELYAPPPPRRSANTTNPPRHSGRSRDVPSTTAADKYDESNSRKSMRIRRKEGRT